MVQAGHREEITDANASHQHDPEAQFGHRYRRAGRPPEPVRQRGRSTVSRSNGKHWLSLPGL